MRIKTKQKLRSITFYTAKYFYRSLTVEGINGSTADEETTPFKEVPIPEDAELGTFADMAMITLRTDYQPPKGTAVFKAGSLVALPMAELMEDDWSNALAMFTPTPSRSLSSTTETKDYLIIKVRHAGSKEKPR